MDPELSLIDYTMQPPCKESPFTIIELFTSYTLKGLLQIKTVGSYPHKTANCQRIRN